MKDLFGILTFLTLVLLIIGLFSPKTSLFWLKNERTRKKSALIYIGVFFLFLICFGQYSESSTRDKTERTENKNSHISDKQEKITQKENYPKTTSDHYYNADGEEVIKEEKLADNSEWTQMSKPNQINGDWLQICWFYPNDESKTYLEKGDSEQKRLTLKKGIYKTSYPFGSGDNPEFAFYLENNELVVTTQSKLASEIYRYQIKINSEKNLLYLKERDGLTQIFVKE